MNRTCAMGVVLLVVVSACLVMPPAAREADRGRPGDERERGARPEHEPGRRERPGPGRSGPGRSGPRRGPWQWHSRPPMPENEMARLGRHIELIQRMQHTSFDPAVAGLVALGALRTDVPREKPEDIIKDLEDVLAQTKTLGLRNSIRMMLKDLYRDQDKHAKVLEHLKAVIAENDAALQEEKKLEASKAAKTK